MATSSFVAYVDEFPHFRDEVLPLLACSHNWLLAPAVAAA